MSSTAASSTNPTPQELRIANKYMPMKKIGNGAFGDIYSAIHTRSKEEVAVKLESVKCKYPQLYYEAKLYKYLHGGIGIPNVYYYGTEGPYNALVMELLGPSL